ncbi:competence type IV pilus assembly protein ComGB [Mesobacillus foraminis]|uniref:competence type IV pilus assembly protein ComGB n=1 Tax=Mesobacillus foraminis TaxID=279826 RepID=UPI000EF4795D|nr:competence type IV pilus assembly protein ComGB [Mesobacillus foraminis]
MNRVNNWTVREQATFLKRAGELLLRGYPLAEAIESVSFYLRPRQKREMNESLSDLREGYPFYQVLTELNFNKNLISYVYFAEQHGGLGNAIIEASGMVLKRDNDFSRLKKLVTYPLILAFMTFILFYFVNHVLLPKFSSLYQDMDVDPGVFVTIITSFGNAIPLLMSFGVILFSASAAYYYLVFRKYSALEQRNRLVRIPVIGKLLKLLYSHFFSVQLSYLFSGGLSVIDALNVFENNTHEPFSVELGREIKLSLSTGLDFDRAIASFSFFEGELYRIIKHGQENGKLDQELFYYSRNCLSQLEEKTDRAMRIVQPVLYTIIGLLIISLYLAILLPMFQLLQGI